jgi:4-alpha-glucanotransferase
VTESNDLIEPYYYDYWGNRVETSDSTRRALLAAMGTERVPSPPCHPEERPLRLRSEQAPRASRRASAVVVREGQRPFLQPDDTWTVELEDGSEFDGDLAELPLGYHTLHSRHADRSRALIVCPPRCYLPGEMRRGRIWALSTQLYALRSSRNWGIGDFTDLAEFARIGARAGARAIALNPLHELHPNNPRAASPYSPSSRLFLNVLYIDVGRVPELDESPEIRAAIARGDFARSLQKLRDGPLVDYRGVATAKFAILERLHRVFLERHLFRADGRAGDFMKFCRKGGAPLERLALYEAIAEHFREHHPTWYGWQQWLAAYQDPSSPNVAHFAQGRNERVGLYLYLQWLAAEQLSAAQRTAGAEGASLYCDLAVGADRNGADVWADRDAFVTDATLGAPPDHLNVDGQNWGLAPFSPLALRERGYRPFIELLRANMRYAGILRVDHVMALRRAFWIPRGSPASSGAYVRYPFDEMLGVLALESARNKCAVVGEDLGTVPEGFRERLGSAGALTTRLFYFSRGIGESFLPPGEYPRVSAVGIGTHDLPTLAGWWTGERSDHEDRAGDRLRFIEALERAGVIDTAGAKRLRDDAARGGTLAVVEELAVAAYRFLGATPSMLVVVAIEDVLGETGGVNVPGTIDEHPNWRRKRSLSLEQIEADGRLMQIGKVLFDR